MAHYDVVDEVVIGAPVDAVWRALLDELRGDSAWWHPHVELRWRGDVPVDEPGAIVDVAVHPGGERRRPAEPRFSSRTTEVEPGRRLRAEYFAGWFRGTSEWTLDRVEGGTRLRLRWVVDTHGALPTFLALIVNMGQRHSQATKKGFTGLARHVATLTGQVAAASP